MSNMDLSLIIPCYNEETILEDNIKDVFEVLDNTRICYEIIFVDDKSKDNTRSIIDKIIFNYPNKNIVKVFHDKNTGRGGAVIDGIKISKGRVTGFIDIDLETHARYIPSCYLAIINKGFDIAIAKRIYKFYFKSLMRYLMSKGYILLVRRLLRINLEDTETGFKFFNREKILPIINETMEKGWFWDTEVMVRSYFKGYKIIEIPCLFVRNFKKQSSVKNVADSIYYFLKLLRFRNFVRKNFT